MLPYFEDVKSYWLSVFDAFSALLVNAIELEKISWLLAGLCFAFFTVGLLNRIHLLTSKWQAAIYKSSSNANFKKFASRFLNLIKVHGAVIGSILIVLMMDKFFSTENIVYQFYREALFVFIHYKILYTAVVYSVEKPYSIVERFVSSNTINEIREEAKIFSRIAIVFFAPALLFSSFHIFDAEYLSVTILIALVLSYFYKKIINPHYLMAHKFIFRQFPDSYHKYLGVNEEAQSLTYKAYLLFILSHLIRILLLVHSFLLRIDLYKKISAKILWMRLEQKNLEDDEDEAVSDERYEKWFLATYRPEKLVEVSDNDLLKRELDHILCGWIEDKYSENDFVLVGEVGLGKTSLIKNWIDKSELDVKTCYAQVPAKTTKPEKLFILLSQLLGESISSLDDLILLDQQISKTVVVLDDGENLFLSKIGGFECYKLWLEIITLPLSNIFWILVINRQSYTYLNDVFGRLNQYASKFEMSPWKASEIRELIMTRHNLSRRNLIFDELFFATLGHDELSSYSATADRCFFLITERTGGNPTFALSVWMRAASRREKFTIEIGVPEKPSVSLLGDYSADLLFIYASLFQHNGLTIEEAASATRQPIAVANRAFKLGRDMGFLVLDENGRAKVSEYWYTAIFNFLRSKNYVHGA